ncbi:MAG: hypothetical protein AAB508_02705 [Patescibacteria group bacterium]
MIQYYQPFLLPFLGRKKHNIPPSIRQTYYHSFEDGLWQILSERDIPKQSIVFVPSFYCMDVIKNISNHGYSPTFYPIDRNFQINESLFITYLKQYKPRVVILFHAVGITNTLIHKTCWRKYISKDTLIIEDSVHTLINPENISIHDKNHIIMDSVRKVSPLRGSFAYEIITGHKHTYSKQSSFSLYIISSIIMYYVFRIMLIFSELFRSGTLTKIAYKKILPIHDDIIGDDPIGHRGISITPILYPWVNFSKIEALKFTQVKLYQKSLKKLFLPKIFFSISMLPQNFGMLHAYPIGIKIKPSTELISYLHSFNIFVWEKFSDCPWAKNKGVLLLPLGFHISNQDIIHISNTLNAWNIQ